MGKGSGGCLGEGEEGAGPNRPTDGNGRWKGVGKVRDTGQREVGQGLTNSDELGRIDGGELDRWKEVGEIRDASRL